MLILYCFLLFFADSLLGEEDEEFHYLTFQEYLAKVKKNNEGYQAACLDQKSFLQERDAVKALHLPKLEANAFYNFDNSPRITPLLQGSDNVFWTSQVGITESLNSGLDLEISMFLNHSQYNNVSSIFFPISDFFLFMNSAQVTQHILKNSFGRQNRAEEDYHRYDFQSRAYQSSSKIAELLNNAENIYWQYAISNKKLKIRHESICFQSFMAHFANKRYEQNLFVNSEVFRTKALLERDKVEYQNEKIQNELLKKKFYALIEEPSRKREKYRLEDVSYDTILAMPLPQKAEWDDALLYQYSLMKKNEAEARKEQQNTLPILDFIFAGSMGGLEEQNGQAWRNAWSFDNANYKLELVFAMPIFLNININTYKSLKRQARAAHFNYQWNSYKRDRDWEVLCEKYQNLLQMASSIRELEQLQKEGYLNEKARFHSGISTIYYVGTFYDNYVKASINLFDVYLQILQTITEMNAYHESSKECSY